MNSYHNEKLVSNKIRSWGFVDAVAPANQEALTILHRKMSEFYEKFATNSYYWLKAEEANEVWKPQTHLYHWHLKTLITTNSTIIDFGCGSAHPVANLKEKNINYIGIDWSKQQVAKNRLKHKNCTFICGDITLDHGFYEVADWAVSFFALEHCIYPHLLLDKMYDSVKPGGHIAIICPNFIYGMNSIRTGFRANTNRDKLKKFQISDLLASYYQIYWTIPKRLKVIHQSRMRFPIYLYPRCLNAPYYSDNDAVHLVNEAKVIEYLREKGAKIAYSSKSVRNTDKESLILYIIAKKLSNNLQDH